MSLFSSRRASALIVGAGLILTITACAPAAPAATEPSRTTNPSTPATPTPIPTGTSTATQDPADPSTWLITTSGIGPSQLGALDDDAIAASLAPAFVVDMRCEGLTAYVPTREGTPLSAYTAVSGTSTSEHPGFFRAVGISAPDVALLGEVDGSPKTAEGVGLGSALADLQTAYPSLEAWEDPRGTTPGFASYVVTDDAGSLLFNVTDDRVTTITATFDLPPVGYCS